MTFDELLAVQSGIGRISLDFENNQSMVDSNFPIVDFDRAKEMYAKGFGAYAPKSCDGLYYSKDDGIIYLIEFKNGKINNDVKTHIYFKILESLWLLSDVINKPSSFFRANCVFLLVYNDAKNRCAIASHIMRNAGGEIVRFGLDRFERLYVKKAHTLNPHEFYVRFVRKWERKGKG